MPDFDEGMQAELKDILQEEFISLSQQSSYAGDAPGVIQVFDDQARLEQLRTRVVNLIQKAKKARQIGPYEIPHPQRHPAQVSSCGLKAYKKISEKSKEKLSRCLFMKDFTHEATGFDDDQKIEHFGLSNSDLQLSEIESQNATEQNQFGLPLTQSSTLKSKHDHELGRLSQFDPQLEKILNLSSSANKRVR